MMNKSIFCGCILIASFPDLTTVQFPIASKNGQKVDMGRPGNEASTLGNCITFVVISFHKCAGMCNLQPEWLLLGCYYVTA